MFKSANYLPKSRVNLILCLFIILSVGLGCMNVKRPWRDYSDRKFDSKEWLAGDEIERGRMVLEIFKEREKFNGKSRDEIIGLFGEPTKKLTVEGREVWLYKTTNRFHNDLNLFPVTFEGKKGAIIGAIKGGTFSMVVDEEWITEP